MQMTIKQLADELGVSKTTINRAVVKLGWKDKIFKVGNRYIFSETQILQIKKEVLESNQEQTEQSEQSQQSEQPQQSEQSQQSEQENTIWREQILILDKQLAIKDEQIRLLQEQLISQSKHIQLLQEQLLAKDNQIGQITEAMENMTTALTAAQALHAGTIQKQLTEYSVMEKSSDEPKQPKQKQGLFSKLFGRREN